MLMTRGSPSNHSEQTTRPKGRRVYRAIGGREWDADELLNKVRALKDNKRVGLN